MLYQGHGFLGGIKHFWIAVRVWKTNLVVEDLGRQKRTKMWQKRGISWGLIDVWQSEWSVVSWIWIAKPSATQKKGSSCPARDCWHLDAASWQCSLSHCHLRERIFGQNRISVVPQPPYSPDLSPCDFFFFPKLKFHLKVVILELWTTSKRSWQTSWGHFYMKTSSTATGNGSNVSGGVWLPKWTTLKVIMLIYR